MTINSVSANSDLDSKVQQVVSSIKIAGNQERIKLHNQDTKLKAIAMLSTKDTNGYNAAYYLAASNDIQTCDFISTLSDFSADLALGAAQSGHINLIIKYIDQIKDPKIIFQVACVVAASPSYNGYKTLMLLLNKMPSDQIDYNLLARHAVTSQNDHLSSFIMRKCPLEKRDYLALADWCKSCGIASRAKVYKQFHNKTQIKLAMLSSKVNNVSSSVNSTGLPYQSCANSTNSLSQASADSTSTPRQTSVSRVITTTDVNSSPNMTPSYNSVVRASNPSLEETSLRKSHEELKRKYEEVCVENEILKNAIHLVEFSSKAKRRTA